MSAARFSSVEEYLSSLTPTKAGTLRAVIDFVLAEFPALDAKIAWNVPQIVRDGDYVFGVSSLKDTLDLAPWSADVIEEFKARLEADGYVVRKHLFQVPDDWELDRALVKDLVQARLAELDPTAAP